MENPDHKKLLSPLGFADDGYEPSLEDSVRGDSRGADGVKLRVTINRCPELIRSTIIALRHKHERLTSQAAVTRYLARQGFQIIQRLSGIKVLKEKQKQAYEHGDERDRILQTKNIYDFGYRISMTSHRLTVYADDWVLSAITELSCDIGTYQETIAIMSLIAACSTSRTWIPARHLTPMMDELIHFAEWINGLAI